MNLIVLFIFSYIYVEGNSQLVRRPRFLQKLQEDVSNVEPYEIHTIKRILTGEKQTKLKSQETLNIQNTEKVPEISGQENYPRQRIKYKKNKTHMLDEPIIHIDTENAIIDYEKNDTIATQRQLVEIESMIIKHSADETNLLDLLNNDDHNDKVFFENMNNTRRLIPIPNHDFDLSHSEANPLIPNENTDDKYNNIERIASSSSWSFNDKLEDDRCSDTGDIETSENSDSKTFDENSRKSMPTSGRGITDLVKSRMMLFNHPRVCYACNSIRDKSCWYPNRTTSVKYCHRNHKFCLVKVYEQRGDPQVIRDCGESCSSFSTVVTGDAYASCTVCNSDLCNSAGGLVMQNIVSIIIVALNIILRVSNISYSFNFAYF